MADTDLLTGKDELREKLKDYQRLLISGDWKDWMINTQECGINSVITLSTSPFVFCQGVLRSKAGTGDNED